MSLLRRSCKEAVLARVILYQDNLSFPLWRLYFLKDDILSRSMLEATVLRHRRQHCVSNFMVLGSGMMSMRYKVVLHRCDHSDLCRRSPVRFAQTQQHASAGFD
jgi:hypothetical protein